MAPRDATLDNARAIGIVAVVAGHAMGTPEAVGALIYAVHMPLFFLLAGWVLKDAVLDLPAADFARRQWRTLGRPAVVFFVAGWAYWLLTARIGPRAAKFGDTAWWEPVAGLVTGRYAELQTVNGPLWFFWALALATGFVWLAARPRWRTVGLPLLAVASVLAVVLRPADRPVAWWNADVALVAAGFVVAGLVLGRRVVPARIPRRVAALVAGLAGPAFAAAVLMGEPGDLRQVDFAAGRFGPDPLAFFGVAVLGLAAVLAVARLMPASTVAGWLSRHTLVVFPTHVIVLNVASGVAQLALGFSAADVRTPAFAAGATLVALAAAVPTAAVLARAWPSLFARDDAARPPGTAPAGMVAGGR